MGQRRNQMENKKITWDNDKKHNILTPMECTSWHSGKKFIALNAYTQTEKRLQINHLKLTPTGTIKRTNSNWTQIWRKKRNKE